MCAMTPRKPPQARSARGDRNELRLSCPPQSAATTAITLRNTSESKILRLPAEIRTRIWALALGDRMLHVKAYFHPNGSYHSGRFGRHEVFDWISTCCICPYTELELFERSKVPAAELVDRDDRRFGENIDATGDVVFVGTIEERQRSRKSHLEQSPHMTCSKINYNSFSAQELRHHVGHNYEESQKHTVDVRILRACRQVYEETTPVLWTTNTFSFTNANDMEMFLDSCTSVQKAMIRSLRFDVNWSKRRAPAKGSNVATIKSLVGLRALYIHISNNAIEYPSFATEQSGWQSRVDIFCQGLSRYKILPISNVTVAIQNHPYGLEEQWPFHARVEQAKRLRERILDAEALKKFETGEARYEEAAAREKRQAGRART